MKKPDQPDRPIVEEFQKDVYDRMAVCARDIRGAHPERELSHIEGSLAAGLAMSLIVNLAQWVNITPEDVCRRLLDELRHAAAHGGITKVQT